MFYIYKKDVNHVNVFKCHPKLLQHVKQKGPWNFNHMLKKKFSIKKITSCFECLAQSKFLARGGHFPRYVAKGGK